MLVYTEAEKQKIRADSSHKELLITFLDDDTFGSIGNDRIYQESLTLVESLCDDENLKFGECESAELKIQVADVTEDIKGHEIQLDLTVNGVLVPLGIYYISNVEKATDKRYKKLTCYDRMIYFQINVIKWYNGLFSTVNTTHTLKEVRDSFFEWMGIEQLSIELPNDNMIVRKTIDAQELSGLKVIQSICEINGMFGHITRDGRFKYVSLIKKGPYPSPTLYPSATLYPGTVRNNKVFEITNANYLPGAERGDYVVKAINKLQVRSESGNVGAIITSDNYTDDTNNSYIVTDNFLAYGSNEEELQAIAQNMSKNVFGITYTPHSTPTVSMPYMEVGDSFRLNAKNDSFRSFIFKRTLSGIQGMKDLWESYGNEYQPDIVEDSNQEIIKLQSRVNVLTRTVDETNSKVERIETDVSGQISTLNTSIIQNAENIALEVNRAIGAEEKLSSQIKVNAEGIESRVEKNGVISAINQSAESVTIRADKINLAGYVTVTDLSETGTTKINGSRLYGGTIVLGGSGNGNGSLSVKAQNGNEIVKLNNEGIYVTSGKINISNMLETTDFITLTASNNSALNTYIGPNHLTLKNNEYNTGTFISASKVQNVDGDYDTTLRGGQLYFSYKNTEMGHIYGDADNYLRIFGNEGIALCSNTVVEQGKDIIFVDLGYKSLKSLMQYAVNNGWI